MIDQCGGRTADAMDALLGRALQNLEDDQRAQPFERLYFIFAMTASGLSKVVVLDPDARACRQVQLGFHREGIEPVAPAIPADLATLQLGLTERRCPGLALVGGTDPESRPARSRARSPATPTCRSLPPGVADATS